MKLRASAAFASLATALLWLGGGACGVTQPKPQCTIGRGGHAVRYTLKTGAGPCASKSGEIVGAQAYRNPESGELPALALQPNTLAALTEQDPDPAHTLYSVGTFTTDTPGPDSFCEVSTLTEARQVVAARDISYRWSNVRIYDSAPIPGTQWTAELTYTENGCTATYEAVGVFPAISCVSQGGSTDVNLCKSRYLGLSLDPSYPVRCDEASGLCVLDGVPPATR